MIIDLQSNLQSPIIKKTVFLTMSAYLLIDFASFLDSFSFLIGRGRTRRRLRSAPGKRVNRVRRVRNRRNARKVTRRVARRFNRRAGNNSTPTSSAEPAVN